MNVFRRKITIEYHWTPDDIETIPKEHLEALEEDALDRIFQMIKEDYTSGELITSVRFGKDKVKEEHEDYGLSYSGSWGITIETE